MNHFSRERIKSPLLSTKGHVCTQAKTTSVHLSLKKEQLGNVASRFQDQVQCSSKNIAKSVGIFFLFYNTLFQKTYFIVSIKTIVNICIVL